MSGKLYIVPTPIGNLSDMTPRAVEVLSQASLILAEDTRTSATLMKHFGIKTPMVSHHKYNEHTAVGQIIERLKGGILSHWFPMRVLPVSRIRALCCRGNAGRRILK